MFVGEEKWSWTKEDFAHYLTGIFVVCFGLSDVFGLPNFRVMRQRFVFNL